MNRFGRIVALTGLAAAGACSSLAPPYHGVPIAALPEHFQQAPGWHEAAPSDAVAKGEWWRLFNDPVLDALEAKVEVTNQTVAQYYAAYQAARALVKQERAALWPQVTAQGEVSRIGGGAASQETGASDSAGRHYTAQIGASWEPDLWGKLRDSVRQAKDTAEASAGDLANATLSAQGELATDYLQLRGIDAQRKESAQTIQGYQRSLQITQNKYRAGVVASSDVDQAQTTLSNAQATARSLDLQRAQLEHAIAVLVGENPSTFSIASAEWNTTVPQVPGSVPSTVLQRRADVAAAERRVAAANAGIGIERAGYFPQFTVSGSLEHNATIWADLTKAATGLWTLGLTGVQTLLDFGATRGRVMQAQAEFQQAAAVYRQAVLTAFQQVEDNLVAVQAYTDITDHYEQAMTAANRAEAVARNQYLAGTVDFTTVVVAEATASTSRQQRIQSVVDQQTAAVALVQALGGSWPEQGQASEPAVMAR